MFKNLKKWLDLAEKMGIPSLDCAVYQNGKKVFGERRGYRDEKGTPLTGEELYNIYSCSKPITCTAALQLYEKGGFRLTDELAEYMPEFGDMTVYKNGAVVKAEKRITIRDLFTMTAGFNYDLNPPELQRAKLETEGKCPTRETMKYLAKKPLIFEPSEGWQYSLCHDVLAALVETVSGERFGQFVKRNIFTPLGMNSTTYLLTEANQDQLAEQYRYYNGEGYKNIGKTINPYRLGSEYESGGAGCITSVNEYILFLEGLRTGKLLKEETLQKMTADALSEQQRKQYTMCAKGYGYGLGVRCPMGDGLRSDFGWGGAAGAFLAVDAKSGITMYHAQHVFNAPTHNIRKDLIEAAKLDLGLPAFEADMWQGTGSVLA